MRLLACLVVVAATAGSVAPLRADDQAAVGYFQGLYDLLTVASDQDNWEEFKKFEAEGYRSIDIDGNSFTGYQEFSMATAPSQLQTQDTLRVRAVEQVGKLVFIEQEIESAFRLSTRTGEHLVEARLQSSDVWRQVGPAFVLLSSRAQRLETTIDGKLVERRQGPDDRA